MHGLRPTAEVTADEPSLVLGRSHWLKQAAPVRVPQPFLNNLSAPNLPATNRKTIHHLNREAGHENDAHRGANQSTDGRGHQTWRVAASCCHSPQASSRAVDG